MHRVIGVLSAPLAHAFGKRYDLPVPLWLFVVGGAMVVFVSFLVVLPRAVAEGPAAWTVHDAVPARRGALIRALLAWVVIGLLVAGGIVGSQEVAENILPTAFWLLIWVATPISCGLIGDWTRPVNPFAALARLVDNDRARQALLGGPAVRWPQRLGWWPAVGLFFAVACGELIFNGTATQPRFTAVALIVYAAVSTLGAFVFGASAWIERGELFSVLFSTWGRIGWFRFGTAGRRGFLGGLERGFEVTPSRVTFVLLMLMSVAFDGVTATPAWNSARCHLFADGAALQACLDAKQAPPSPASFYILATLTFVAMVAAAWLVFGLFAVAVRRAGSLIAPPMEVLAGLLPSLLPIAFGYLVAHNAEYLLINGQLLIPLLGNPAGVGWHLLPAPFDDSYVINVNLVPSSVVWYAQVALIIAVHIAAVVLAHRYLAHAARDRRSAQRSEWPWVAAMVGYTMTSLWLLAQPLVQESSSSSTGPQPATHIEASQGTSKPD
jgi:hypothetical protein